ncbi:unnamed protein product, partial [Staurois parvus]
MLKQKMEQLSGLLNVQAATNKPTPEPSAAMATNFSMLTPVGIQFALQNENQPHVAGPCSRSPFDLTAVAQQTVSPGISTSQYNPSPSEHLLSAPEDPIINVQ